MDGIRPRGCDSAIDAYEEMHFFVLCTQYIFMCLTNLIRRVVFMTSGELAIPGGVFMAGGGLVGGWGGVRPCDSICGQKRRYFFTRVLWP